MFTDTHCHLLKEYYSDINKIVADAKVSGIHRFINAAYDGDSINEVVSTCNLISEVYGVIGLHPSEAKTYTLDDIENIEKNIGNNKIIGIGEIGLDYHYGKEDADRQKELFICQLNIAKKHNLPVVIHSRDATEETMHILKQFSLKGVIHSFNGSLETAKDYIKMGYVLGINGVVTFKNCKLIEIIKQISLSDLVFETDSPYLTPEPNRGHQNDPSKINDIVNFISKACDYDKSLLASKTEENIKRIFDI